jgi:hypothetical protein
VHEDLPTGDLPGWSVIGGLVGLILLSGEAVTDTAQNTVQLLLRINAMLYHECVEFGKLQLQ